MRSYRLNAIGQADISAQVRIVRAYDALLQIKRHLSGKHQRSGENCSRYKKHNAELSKH
jgi:hypothetical protein